MSLETLTYESLKLSQTKRITLAHLLIKSIDDETNPASNDSEFLQQQMIEVKRRINLYKNGGLKSIPSTVVRQKLADKYGL